jgi:methionyl-tRNA formyltransferase
MMLGNAQRGATTMFNPRRIMLVGCRGLSVRCLRFFLEEVGRHRIAGVVTIPKGQRGWWRDEPWPELWQVAEQNDLPLVDASKLESTEYDFLCSVLWEKILSETALQRASYGAINLHPAPLPEYRGARTRSHAILNGETEYGVSIHHMVKRIDAGDLIDVLRFPIAADDTALSLDRRTVAYGYPLFCQTWLRLVDGSARREAQSEILKRTGHTVPYYTLSSLDPYFVQPRQLLGDDEVARRYRALYLPPVIHPPAWLVDEAARRGLIPDKAQPIRELCVQRTA